MKVSSKVRFLDYSIVSCNINECVDDIACTISDTVNPRWFVCLNPHSHIIAKNDSAFSAALHASDWMVPDGSGVVLASRFLGCPVHERITGSDVFHGLHDRLNRQGGAAFSF